MYKLTFIPDGGDPVVLGPETGMAVSIEDSGMVVSLARSQGFGQIGDTIDGQTVSGRALTLRGAVYGKRAQGKGMLQRLFAPFRTGRLIFGGWYLYVYVKGPPVFSPSARDGRFMMELYAPYPFWRSTTVRSEIIGKIDPLYRLPINFSKPHAFGKRSPQRYINVQNRGALPVLFDLDLTATAPAVNPVLTNLVTQEKIQFEGTLQPGSQIHLSHDPSGVLTAQLLTTGAAGNIISWVSDDSTLYLLAPGDNLLQASDRDGGGKITARISYSEAVTSVYEADPV